MLLLIAISKIIQHNTLGNLQFIIAIVTLDKKNEEKCKSIHVNFLLIAAISFELSYTKLSYFAQLFAYLYLILLHNKNGIEVQLKWGHQV